MTAVTTLAFSTVILLGLVSGAAAASGQSEGAPVLVHETEPPQQPPASNARPHLRPRPAPDRFFDLVLTKPGKPASASPITSDTTAPALATGS